MAAAALKRLSVDDYLALEQSSDVKHEYFDGEIFALAGGTASHSLVAVNLSAELRNALKARGCRVYSSDMMVFCPTGLRTYPDVSVTCESPRYEDDRELTLLNPLLIVEALSTTTEAYDRGRKFNHYQSIPSLREYLLVSTDRAHVDHFTRLGDGRWALTTYDGLGDRRRFAHARRPDRDERDLHRRRVPARAAARAGPAGPMSRRR